MSFSRFSVLSLVSYLALSTATPLASANPSHHLSSRQESDGQCWVNRPKENPCPGIYIGEFDPGCRRGNALEKVTRAKTEASLLANAA
ncbi:MAG: hypothetical protein Q9183_007963, partial [Haloplaca sp. 2 TL-2023]